MEKSYIKKTIDYIRDPLYRFNVNSRLGIYNNVSDEKYITKQYKLHTGKEINLAHPRRFNEKMQWLKLYDRNPMYTTMVDKYSVKKYVDGVIGKGHVAELIDAWDNPDLINLEVLPEQFVLKTTHGSGDIFVCKDKSRFDIITAKIKLKKSLSQNYYWHCREWPYKNVKPRVFAEKLLQNEHDEHLGVYKIFNFSGMPYIIQVIQDDKTDHETIDYFDTNWKLLDLRQNFPNSTNPLNRPKTLDKMLEYAEKCSQGFPFLRTDWYEVNGEVYFSEFTFYSDAGYASFYPDVWDLRLGDMIDLALCNTKKWE